MPIPQHSEPSAPLKKKKKLSGHSGPSCISAARMPEMSKATPLPPDATAVLRWRPDIIPIAPHLLFPQFLDDNKPKERELGLFFGNAILSKCAEMWVFGDRISEGMEAEIKRATWKGHRIRYFSETCEEVIR